MLVVGGVHGGDGLLGESRAQRASADTSVQRAPMEADSVDAVLQERLRGIYDQVDAFRSIDVTVRRRVVRLDGKVLQSTQASEAAELARSLDGVVYVTNDIVAETDLADRVSPALSRIQNYGNRFFEFLPVVLIALLVALATLGAARWIGGWEVPPRWRMTSLGWGLIRRTLQVAVVLIGLVVTFDLLGVTSIVGALLGTAGVAGLAVGFAFRDIIENYLAGVLLGLRQPFHVNDVVSIDGHEGRVVRLTAREVVLLTFDGNHVRLPNATVFKNVLVNYTRNAQRLFFFDVGVGGEEDLSEVQRTGVETLDLMNGVLSEPPPYARVRELGDSSVVVRFHGWVDQEEADFFKVKSEAIRLVKQALEETDVDMPEPIYRLQLYRSEHAHPHAAKGPGSSVAENAPTIDVAPDGRLQRKVEEELRASDEPNHLSRE